MANKKWSDVFTANPSTTIQANDIINLARSGSPTAGKWGTLSNYQNIIYIANNGDDTHGNGSLLCPYASGPAVETFISSSSPSTTNRFLIIDQRTGIINEAVKFIPFVDRIGNGLAELNGNWTMSTLYSSIASNSFSSISNYKSLGATTPGTVVFDFSSFSLTYAIHITLQDFEQAIFTGTYKGNDSANFNADTFRINENNFNTAYINPDHSRVQSNIALSSGLERRIRYCEFWQCSSITKSLGSVPCVSSLNVAFCGLAFYDPITTTLKIISSGGASNQPIINVIVVTCISGNTTLILDITNDGESFATILTDITTGYYISSADSLTNFTFENFSNVDYQSSSFVPTNYTRISYDDDGFTVGTDLLGSQLNGIDIVLGTLKNGPGLIIDQTSDPVTMNLNTTYLVDNGASIVNLTLPTTSNIGDFVEVIGNSSGGWLIAQATGQQIHLSSSATTSGAGGSVASINQYNCIKLRCVVANTIWVCSGGYGTYTVI